MECEKSCGCIIIEDGKVLMVKQTKGHWGFPKGHIEDDETEVETAIREVKEETNIDVDIEENKRYTMRYATDKGNMKEIVYFVARKVCGEVKAQECEIDEIEWLDFIGALERIAYDDCRELFREVVENIGQKWS